jgi:hypothetical protein
MPELLQHQKRLWRKAKDAGVTLPNDAETADLSRAEIEDLAKRLDRGEDVFGVPGRSPGSQSPPSRAGAPRTAPDVDPGLLEALSGILTSVTRIADAVERIADRSGS